MKFPAGNAWEGILASLLLHLAVAVALLYGWSAGPGRTLPVIDLTLLPSSTAGGPETAPPAKGGRERRAGNITARPASPSPPPAPAQDAAPGMSAAEPETAGAPPSASASAGAPSATVPRASSHAAGSPGDSGGPGPLSAPSSTPSGVVSTEPGYDYLRNAIQREVTYPPVARRMGWEGRVVVAFVIQPNGSVRDVRVVRGSGHAVLDRNAVEAVRSASPFSRPPAEAEVRTPVVYKLD